jgi:predicted peroxiredoxin
MTTCSGVKLATKKKMKDGDREWTIPSFVYYGGHKHGQMQTTTNHYAATAMTQTLAEQLTAKLKASGVEATVCDLFADLDTVIYETLVDIGEETPPPRATNIARWVSEGD